MADLVVTIDGPAGSGKSTVAKLLAKRIGASFLDTGAMYRAVTLAAMEAKIDMEDAEQLLGVLENNEFVFKAEDGKMLVFVNGADVSEAIRRQEVTANVRYVASAAKLRSKLVEMQREYAAGEKRIVTEGRDQGTVAFADAGRKFFLVADVAERARRRAGELEAGGAKVDIAEIQKAIEQRDKSDESRAVGPLKPAEDAIIVDTTELNIEQVVGKLLDHVERKG